jgi:hypothetical protein
VVKQLLLAGLLFTFSNRGLSQTAIDSTGYLSIGGIEQFVSIKDKDNRNPLLLFLHGGPGNSVIHYAEKFTNKSVAIRFKTKDVAIAHVEWQFYDSDPKHGFPEGDCAQV